MREQENKTAIVTGAAKRIGFAIALDLHERGYDIAIHYGQSKTEAIELYQRLNDKRKESARLFQAELSDKAALKILSESILAWRSNISVLLNNASSFVNDKQANRDHLFHTNVRAPYLLSHLFKESLAQTRGCIINMADIYGEQPLKGYTVYCMSKAALLMQTLCLAQAFAPEVRVNAILPGVIAWPEDKTALSEAVREQMLSAQLLHKVGGYDAIVKTVRYLIESDFVTGAKCVVDGGRAC